METSITNIPYRSMKGLTPNKKRILPEKQTMNEKIIIENHALV